MKFSEVKELLAAGFTAAEIRSMEESPEGAAPEGAQHNPGSDQNNQESDQKNQDHDQNNHDPEQAGVSESVKALSDTVKELQKTIKEMQAANLAGARQEQAKQPTAEDAIKNFLSKM